MTTASFEPHSGGGGNAPAYKLVVVGDGCVGKTCLLTRFRDGHFPYDYIPTVFDQSYKDFVVDNEPATLSLWDTAGQEEFARTRPLTYPFTDIFLICFAVSDPTSFYNVKLKWLPEVRIHCPTATLVLVGTKKDLRGLSTTGSSSSLDTARGLALARELKISLYEECSALKDDNIQTVFDAAVRARRQALLKASNKNSRRRKCSII